MAPPHPLLAAIRLDLICRRREGMGGGLFVFRHSHSMGFHSECLCHGRGRDLLPGAECGTP